MSNEAASHLEFRYSQLRSEFNEQMGQANAIMVYVGTDANAHINQLRLELENAEMNAKQEALAVGLPMIEHVHVTSKCSRLQTTTRR